MPSINNAVQIQARDIPGQRSFREADTVVTTTAVKADGRFLPAGSEGTVIDVSPIEGHYGVEFLAPFPCIVFLDKSVLT